MQLPEQLTKSLGGIKDFDTHAFENVHRSLDQITSIRINPKRSITGSKQEEAPPSSLPIHSPVPWSQYGYYLSQRPSFIFDPLFHAGCYYVQEASSMFIEQALKQTIDLAKPIRILDLCAAPGGKSTHIQSLISKESLLISNEVIRSRINSLKENIIKWGSSNVIVTNNDPNDFSKLENYFDVIVVDAPCSGSGLFRRDEEAIDEWSLSNVTLCSRRQQRILADVWPALKKDGVLIYSTCSYSKEENEDILDWMTQQFAVTSLQLSVDTNWGITEVQPQPGAWGYRFWPYKTKGEGFFTGCFRKKEGVEGADLQAGKKIEGIAKKENEILKQFIAKTDHFFLKHNNIVGAIPLPLKEGFNLLLKNLKIQYPGTVVGELFGEKFVPAHSLAMSDLINETFPSIELNREDAIRYLQKKEMNATGKEKGWMIVKYKEFNLGWIKVLSNRVNNYYPKEMRILKDID